MCDQGIEITLPKSSPTAFNPDCNNHNAASRNNKFSFFKNKRTVISIFISTLFIMSTIIFAGLYFSKNNDDEGAIIENTIVSSQNPTIYNTQIERIPRNWPKLDINVNLSDNDLKVDNFEFKDFILEGYSPHPTIKAEMAV